MGSGARDDKGNDDDADDNSDDDDDDDDDDEIVDGSDDGGVRVGEGGVSNDTMVDVTAEDSLTTGILRGSRTIVLRLGDVLVENEDDSDDENENNNGISETFSLLVRIAI
jgi:hypothetical protein